MSRRLRKIKFEETDIEDKGVDAICVDLLNKIVYDDDLKYKTNDQIKETKLHEAYHYLFLEGFVRSNIKGIGLSLDEGCAQLLTEESNAYANVGGFEKNVFYVKVLCELIGTENFQSAMAGHRFSELIGYLKQYGTKAEAKELIKCIDNACVNIQNLQSYDRYNRDEDHSAWDLINKMYYNKNGVTIEDSNDAVMKYYSNKLNGTTYSIKGAIQYHHVTVINKNYFFDINKQATIELSQLGTHYGTLYLDDNNEVIKVNTDTSILE